MKRSLATGIVDNAARYLTRVFPSELIELNNIDRAREFQAFDATFTIPFREGLQECERDRLALQSHMWID